MSQEYVEGFGQIGVAHDKFSRDLWKRLDREVWHTIRRPKIRSGDLDREVGHIVYLFKFRLKNLDREVGHIMC